MAFKRTNRWDVQVAFPSGAAFGMKNRTDVPQSPETVVEALEEFCQRARNAISRRAKAEGQQVGSATASTQAERADATRRNAVQK